MVYHQRRASRYGYRGTRRGTGSVLKKALMRRPTAQNQKEQIVALARNVSRIDRKSSIGKQISPYQTVFDTTVAADYAVHDLVVPASWTNIFADPDSVENATRVSTKSVQLDILVTANTEITSPVDFTCFVVSLKSDTADQLMSIAGSDLNGLVSGAHYAKASSYSGLVHLNEQFFTIHRKWKFTVTSELYTSPTEQSKQATASFKRLGAVIPWNRRLWSGRNGWRSALTSDRVASQAKLYVLMFNNNSGLDFQNPHVIVNGVWKCEAF